LIVRLLVSHVLMPTLERLMIRRSNDAGTDLNTLAPDQSSTDSKPFVFGVTIQALRVFDSLASIFRLKQLLVQIFNFSILSDHLILFVLEDKKGFTIVIS
jgi:hypothetical protein